MKLASTLLSLAILASLSSTASAEIVIDVIGGSEISFEGMLQADYNHFDNDVKNLNGDAKDGSEADSELRRAELVFKGKGPGQWEWVAGYDAKADKYLDINVKYKFNAFTNLTIGQFKQPNSLEELSSTKNNDFISKAMTTNLQGVARRVGIAATTGGENWTLTGSYFDRELTRNLANGRGFGIRGTWAPINQKDNFLHLGVSGVNYDAKDATADGRARFQVRPDADLASARLIDSGQFTNADQIRTLGAEGMWVKGPFKLQTEYMQTDVSRDSSNDYSFDSWYVSGVWNITGESWGYKSGNASTVLPDNPTRGMWQLGLRYDHADLNDDLVYGGIESNWTVGVNCYLRSNFKLAANYVMVDSERGATPVQDNPNIFELRAQIYW